MEETWKPIPNYPGYEASNIGRIKRTASRDAFDRKGVSFTRGHKEVVLSQRLYDKYDAMLSVQVHYGNNYVRRKVHRLVGLTFLNTEEVTHVSDDKRNNSVSNLRPKHEE